MSSTSSNFSFLSRHSPELVEIASRAERYFTRDPITALIWARQFGECLAQLVAARSGLLIDFEESQQSLLNRLRREGGYPSRVIDSFHYVRRAGNSAVHDRQGDHQIAIACLRKCRELGIWFHVTFGGRHQGIGSFVIPTDELATREEVETLRREVETARAAARTAAIAAAEAHRKLETEAGDREAWQNLAIEAEREKDRLLGEVTRLQDQLQEMQDALQTPPDLPPAMSERRDEGPELIKSAIVARLEERDPFLFREIDPGAQIRRSFNVRLKKIQAKFRSISSDDRKKLSKLARLAARFMD